MSNNYQNIHFLYNALVQKIENLDIIDNDDDLYDLFLKSLEEGVRNTVRGADSGIFYEYVVSNFIALSARNNYSVQEISDFIDKLK